MVAALAPVVPSPACFCGSQSHTLGPQARSPSPAIHPASLLCSPGLQVGRKRLCPQQPSVCLLLRSNTRSRSVSSLLTSPQHESARQVHPGTRALGRRSGSLFSRMKSQLPHVLQAHPLLPTPLSRISVRHPDYHPPASRPLAAPAPPLSLSSWGCPETQGEGRPDLLTNVCPASAAATASQPSS